MTDRKTKVHKGFKVLHTGTRKIAGAAKSYKSVSDKESYVKKKENSDISSGKDKRSSGERNSYGKDNDKRIGSVGRNSYGKDSYGKDNDKRIGSVGRNSYGKDNDKRIGSVGRNSYGKDNDKRIGSVGRNSYGKDSYGKDNDRRGSSLRSDDRTYNSAGGGTRKPYRAEEVREWRDKTDKSKGSYSRDRYNRGAYSNKVGYSGSKGDSDKSERTGRNGYVKSSSYGNRRENGVENSKKKRTYNSEEKNKQMIGCPIYEKCGGCLGQEESYEEHLSNKQVQLQELLSEFCKIDSIIGMKDPYHYRNKAHAVFDHDRENPICGVYEEGTHKVIPMEKCKIENQKASAIILSIRDLLKSFKIKTFDEDSGHGLLRHVLVRTGLQSGEIMVVLVLSSLIMPSKNNFVKALLKLHPEITTIIVNENYRKTNVILGEKEQIIYGKGFIQDTLCGNVFRILPKSFYQINPVQSEILYKTAISFAELTGRETILDAYCGIGTIGMIASKQARKVIGVEINADAIKDATFNAKKNQITNIDFYSKDAGQLMCQIAESESVQVDVVFLDPPKSGCDEKCMDAMAALKPRKVIYISCNPYALAGDLEYLRKRGYEVKKMAAIDLLPWTKHVEVVIQMTFCGDKKK